MGTSTGPIETDKSSLIFCVDSQDIVNSATALGAGDWSGHNQGMRDRISQVVAPFNNGVRLAGRDYYTAIGISYPEGSYGGDAANRNGLTPGYNVRSGGKTYDASRSLHLWVWNNQTSSWVSGYFNGARLGGHCYDNYAGAENGWENEMAKFAADYNTVKTQFPDCTYIIVGSHACQCFRQADVDILVDLGAPSGTVSSWTDNSAWREFVLVGRPGLRSGNAYGWAYQNYPTNSDQVAHMNFGLPIKPRGGWLFDGSNDYVSFPSSNVFDVQTVTVEVVVKPATTFQYGFWFEKGAVNTQYSLFMEGDSIVWRQADTSQYTSRDYLTANAWNHVVATFRAGERKTYVNNILRASDGLNKILNTNQGAQFIGSYNSGGYHYNGEIGIVKVYDKVLTAQEIAKNYANYKTRFNLP